MARVLSFLIRYFSNYYTLLCSDLAARAAPLDSRLILAEIHTAPPGQIPIKRCQKNGFENDKCVFHKEKLDPIDTL